MSLFKQERAKEIAGKCEENSLKTILKSYRNIEIQGKQIFEEEF